MIVGSFGWYAAAISARDHAVVRPVGVELHS
jgi:hypothetical protein